MTHDDITKMLQREMVPALGCTGPTAYALAAARCRPLMTGPAEKMKVYVSPAFLKIGFGVATPGTAEPGIPIAAAIGLMGGDWTLGLSVLKTCTEEDIERARSFVREGRVEIFSDEEQTGVYVRAEVTTANETVAAVISGTHDGIISVELNGKSVFSKEMPEEAVKPDEDSLTPDMIFDYVDSVNTEELAFLLDGYELNMALAEDGLKHEYGLASGRAYLKNCQGKSVPADLYDDPMKYMPDSLEKKVKILVSAASDARMGGSSCAALAAMGDGNQGITATIPVGLAAEEYGADREKTIRALALSCLMLFYVKIHIGRAAAFCMCAIAAASGVAASVTYLKGGDRSAIRAAVKNVIAPLAGMLCDGAKNACALKMEVAAATALIATELAEAKIEVGYYDGVADETLEETVEGVTSIAMKSMNMLDGLMVEEILAKENRKNTQADHRQ